MMEPALTSLDSVLMDGPSWTTDLTYGHGVRGGFVHGTSIIKGRMIMPRSCRGVNSLADVSVDDQGQ